MNFGILNRDVRSSIWQVLRTAESALQEADGDNVQVVQQDDRPPDQHVPSGRRQRTTPTGQHPGPAQTTGRTGQHGGQSATFARHDARESELNIIMNSVLALRAIRIVE